MCLAVPGQITAIDESNELTRMGEVTYAGIQREVSLAFVPEAGLGDYVLVHAGFAISRLDEAEAQATLQALQQIAELSGVPMGNEPEVAAPRPPSW